MEIHAPLTIPAAAGLGKILTSDSVGNATWQSGSGPDIKQTEIDFGARAWGAAFTIVDAAVNAGSQITGNIAYEAPTARDRDEVEMEQISLSFAPGAGQLTIFATALDGPIHGKFKINYLVG
ncbi:MAG: hypothetical protein JHC87_01815 [Thermoleophilaceae bacterium]|nr:hypothetical protein [Thermoleophilaceae bacterium]